MRYRLAGLAVLVGLLCALASDAQFSPSPGSRPRSANQGQLLTSGPSGSFVVLPPVHVADLPLPCLPGRVYEVLDAPDACALTRCMPAGTGYSCLGPTSSGTATTGIRTSATTLQTVRPEVTDLAGAQTLGLVHTVCAQVTASAASFTLPAWADTTMPGHIEVDICDAGTNALTITPNGTDTINWVAAPMTAISGRGSGVVCKRRDTNNWKCMTDAPVPLADLGGETVVCKGVDGDTNDSVSGFGAYYTHSLQCEFPANTLRANTFLTACSQFKMTTGTAAPLYYLGLDFNSAILFRQTSGVTASNSITTDSVTFCFLIGISGSGATLSTYTAPLHDTAAWAAAATRNETLQPVTIDGTVIQTLRFKTQWLTAGTGTNTSEQTLLYVKMHR